MSGIRKYGLEAGDERYVRVLISRCFFVIEKVGFMAEGTNVEISIFSSICHARIDAAVVYCCFEIGEVKEKLEHFVF